MDKSKDEYEPSNFWSRKVVERVHYHVLEMHRKSTFGRDNALLQTLFGTKNYLPSQLVKYFKLT